jgi:hypothetical protein
MKSATSFIANLRRAGVSLRQEGSRLIVEAPHGVVTQDIHAHMVRSKQELLAALARESAGLANRNQEAADAAHEICGLLAVAYGRFSAVRRVATDRSGAQRRNGLALPGELSVHGVE